LVGFFTCLVLVDALAAGDLVFFAGDFLGDLAAGLADFLGVAFLLFFFFFGYSS